jgi:hypothetical protein
MAAWPTVDQLKRALGVTSDDAGRNADLQLALDAAIEQVELDIGTVGLVDAPSSSCAQAALVLAVMVMKAPDAPYGIAGVFDQSAVKVAADHPTYQRLIAGQRAVFPIA